jgi:hypothetical protein
MVTATAKTPATNTAHKSRLIDRSSDLIVRWNIGSDSGV